MLLGPLAGRQMSEFLGPMVERELDLLARAGQIPPMPQELAEAGGEYKIEYDSPLARAQRAEEGVAIVRTFEERERSSKAWARGSRRPPLALPR